MLLSKNFTLEEMCASSTATRLGIKNVPNDTVKKNLRYLAQKVLQPLRDWWGKAIIISSGYRCEQLNRAVGGATTSQHKLGMAADISFKSNDTGMKLFNYIKDHLVFDQLIFEHNKAGVYWIHVSYRPDGLNRNQVIGNLLKK